MNDRRRHALQWLAAAAAVFIGLLLLFSAASQVGGMADPARQGVNWPALQTIVAFVLFDVALLVGLVVARLRSQPTSLSLKALLATAASAALLGMALLVVALDWPLNLADLAWTLVLIAGFGLLLALGMLWSAFRRDSTPERLQPAHNADSSQLAQASAKSQGPVPNEILLQSQAKAEPEPEHDNANPLAYLTTLVGGDSEAAERLVAIQQTLDPGASRRESIARAVYKLVRDRA